MGWDNFLGNLSKSLYGTATLSGKAVWDSYFEIPCEISDNGTLELSHEKTCFANMQIRCAVTSIGDQHLCFRNIDPSTF